MKSDEFDVGMYIIDCNYRLMFINECAKDMFPDAQAGAVCHKAMYGSDTPCVNCPVGRRESSLWVENRNEWISATAAKMELPDCGGCHSIQFKIGGQPHNRLKSERFDAIQLLAAINTTYDMVVSVNLTQNTYRLFNSESFVTQGDEATGVFDEVIEIHHSKVAQHHKQLYYDTFSRQALLKAYADGRNSVYLEYQQYDDDGIPHWLATRTMFTENPYSSDVTEITISKNIDDRIYAEQQNKAALQQALHLAEQANRAKSNFLSAMSHDIRTPMNAIVGFTQLSLNEDDFSVVKGSYLPKMKTAGEHLLMLINDVLEMSRIESGKIELKEAPYHLGEISRDIEQVIGTLASEKQVIAKSEGSVSDYYVYCDKLRINQIITNLVSNAVKFTPVGGTVMVSVRQDVCDEHGYAVYEFNISDTGIGMSEEFLRNVFDPFEREKTSTVTRVEGTGLGLSIVKNLVDMMGGTIDIQSQINKGTNVRVRLKLRLAEPDVIAGLKKSTNSVQDINAEDAGAYFEGKRLLLVEDNELNRIIAETILAEAGFAVETADDGIYAVDMVKNAADDYYDAVLMDVQMPIMNGYEATKAIRALDGRRSGVKIIAVTANAFESDVEEAIKAGMNAHISKPIKVDELYKVLLREISMEE